MDPNQPSPQQPSPDQQPYAQPPYQQAPYPQAAPPQWTPETQPPPGYGAPLPPPKSKRGRIIGLIVLAVVVIGVIGFFALRDRLPNDVTSLAAGECFDRGTESTVSNVQRQPCNEAHDAEVVIALTHPADSTVAYPVVSGFDDFISANCIPAFDTYVGRAFASATDLDLGYFQPTLTGWGEGDRGITCFVYRTDGQKMTASIRAGASPAP